MKFPYLAIASAFLTLIFAGPVNIPRQGVSNFQLSCNGTSGVECNKAWWTFCSAEGNIIMAAPQKWKAGDCTDLHCNCIDPTAPKPKPTVIGTEAHYRLPHTRHHGSATTTATFTRPTETLPPKTITINPGTTPIPGSLFWKWVRDRLRAGSLSWFQRGKYKMCVEIEIWDMNRKH